MEAEVLNPPPDPCSSSSSRISSSRISSAELEVLKLQELVRQLERQNQQLRCRAGNPGNPGNPCSVGSLGSSGTRLGLRYDPPGAHGGTHGCRAAAAEEEPLAYFQPSCVTGSGEEDGGAATVLDQVELLDLAALLPTQDPDRWLYVSPRAGLQSDSVLSPLQWCRRVLDHLGPEVELAKMTLCSRLDQARRWRGLSSVRPYSCMEGLSALSCPVLPYNKPAALAETPVPSPVPSGPGRASCSLSDRAPTFLSSSGLHGRRRAAVTPQSSLDSEAGVSELEDESISMSYKLQDMTDVEVMARLQEESLRQDYASTSATAGRRCSSLSLHSLRRSQLDLEEEDEEDEGYDQLPPPQPRLFRAGPGQRGGLPHSHTFSSIRDCRRGSNAPPFPLGGLSQFSGPPSLIPETLTAYRTGADKLRRSMPNLIRAPSMPSVPTAPAHPPSLPAMPPLRSSQSFDSSSGLVRLQSSIPAPGQLGQRVQSVGSFPAAPRHPVKATAYVSPTVQQGPAPALTASASLSCLSGGAAVPLHPLKPSSSLLPLALKAGASANAPPPRSSLPRPASFIGASGLPRSSKIAQPARSLLPPPKSLAALSALRDGSWRDGCY